MQPPPPPPRQCVDHLTRPSCPYAPHAARPSKPKHWVGFHRNYMVPRARFRVRARRTRVSSRCTRERERESVLRGENGENSRLQQRGGLAQITIALGAVKGGGEVCLSPPPRSGEEQPQEDTTTTTTKRTKRTRRIAVKEEKNEKKSQTEDRGRGEPSLAQRERKTAGRVASLNAVADFFLSNVTR